MRADQTKVRQTLFNLLSNASKFTEKGVITLEVWRTDGVAQAFQPAGSGGFPALVPGGLESRRTRRQECRRYDS